MIADDNAKMERTLRRLSGTEKEIIAKLETITKSKVDNDISLSIAYDELQFELMTIRQTISDIQSVLL